MKRDYHSVRARAKRLGQRLPLAARVGGARIVPKWNWSKGYRACVTQTMSALRKIETYLPYVGDVPTSGGGGYRNSAECRDIMRAALSILENRGVDVRQAHGADVSDIEAVRVGVGKVTHLVNLAPKSRATFPAIADTFAAGTLLLSTEHTRETRPASGRYHGIFPGETCEEYCDRHNLPWPAYDDMPDPEVIALRTAA